MLTGMNETISRTKYVFQNESIRKVRNESIRKVGTKYSRTNQFSSLGAECIVTIVQLYYVRSSNVLFHIALAIA